MSSNKSYTFSFFFFGFSRVVFSANDFVAFFFFFSNYKIRFHKINQQIHDHIIRDKLEANKYKRKFDWKLFWKKKWRDRTKETIYIR